MESKYPLVQIYCVTYFNVKLDYENYFISFFFFFFFNNTAHYFYRSFKKKKEKKKKVQFSNDNYEHNFTIQSFPRVTYEAW